VCVLWFDVGVCGGSWP